METTPGDEDKSKLEFEVEKQICRCCLTTEKRMKSAVEVQQYFMELAGINVSVNIIWNIVIALKLVSYLQLIY